MSSKVLIGEGTPRIIILESSAVLSGEVKSVNGKTVELDFNPDISSAVVGKQFISKTDGGTETKGKIIDYDNTFKTVTVDSWSVAKPAYGANYEIKNEVIDLPRTEELEEWFEPEFLPEKKFWNTGKIEKGLKGFYYRCILHYESYMIFDEISKMQNIYSANRTGNFKFVPRRDNPFVEYECQISEESLRYAQLRAHQGHKYIAFYFIGLERLTEPNLKVNKNNIYQLAGAQDAVAGADGTAVS